MKSIEKGVFNGLPALERLYLAENDVTRIESGVFSGLSRLEVLTLRADSIMEIEGGAFAGLQNLATLEFGGRVAIADFSEASFGQLTKSSWYNYIPNIFESDPIVEIQRWTHLPRSDALILDDALVSGDANKDCGEWGGWWAGDFDGCRGDFGLDDMFSQVNPVSAFLVGTQFAHSMPAPLLAGAERLDHLTVDEYLYDSFIEELDAFAAEEGNTLTIIGYGDANADGFFNSSDLVQVFQAGEYEDGVVNNSYWSTGDWYQDGEFNSADIVYAFQLG